MKIVLVVSYLLGSLLLPNPFADEESTISVIHAAPEKIHLNSVNGISLDDDMETVVEKKGTPQRITVDRYFAEFQIYEYADMNIIFRDNVMDSIEFDKEKSFLYLDESKIPVSIQTIRAALGEPDFIAEDGLVFQRNEAVLKLFINPDNGDLDFISYYHINSE
ncbi:hypothetical protein ACFSTH_06830 [Paenibacillus yanchengensis]|uniref:Copper amine oxidase-like N-terminal domain-containing protein n=1 Tax=Paenibacillus yanchengensis TaxID=2035833 RepID=A0ABW4YIP4_9BACL